ncbi:MAG: hypothetical protein QQN63_09805 [Nitrosopumilus sp.]
MIRRHYFARGVVYNNDGSYSSYFITISGKSFFPDPGKIFKASKDHLEEMCAQDGIDGSRIDIQQFNRL